MRIVAIVQARVGSTRLPAKVLLPLGGLTALERCLRRVQRIEHVAEVIVATSEQPADDLIVRLSHRLGFRSSRGSEHDVLSRYAHAALASRADVVIRCTSDCPLLDPAVSSVVVARLEEARGALDYASNTLERRLPRGLDTEAFTTDALMRAHTNARESADREHVTRYLYKNPAMFRCVSALPEIARDLSAHRWTLDTLDDYRFLATVFDRLGDDAANANMQDVLRLVEADPALMNINAHVEQKAH